jgi:hypothetical protein
MADSKQCEIQECPAPGSTKYKSEAHVDRHVFESTRGRVD